MSQLLPEPTKIIKQNFPNQQIRLYEGSAEILDSENRITGKAYIRISWYPFPKATVRFVYYGDEMVELKDTDVRLTESPYQAQVKVRFSDITSYSNNAKRKQVLGDVIEPLRQGLTQNLSSLVFYVSNFWWFNISNIVDVYIDDTGEHDIYREGWLDFDGQFIFDHDNWHIVLACLDYFALEDKLDAQGGYGITHICKIERLDDQSFDLDKGYEIVDAFIYYLSFVRGMWVAPLLVSGFDSNGNQILEEWRTPKIKADSWQSTGYSWTTNDSTEIVRFFPGFMQKWQDSIWKEVVQNAIQWYIESFRNNNGYYNTSIVLIQAALEKLAWTYLKTNECVTSDGFNGLKAYGQIRLLLKFLDVTKISFDDYPTIKSKARELNWIDSIQAITEVRNAIIHPISKGNRFVPEETLPEAFTIGHDYLRECLLKLFESNNS